MRKRVLLQTAVLLAATVNLSEVAASCFPPAKGQTPLDVLECLQSVLDTQQKQIDSQQKQTAKLEKEAKISAAHIAKLEKENQALQQKVAALTEDLQRQNQAQQQQIKELQTALSSLQQKMNAMAFPPLHFLKCGETHYQCTPKMCLEKCISLGLRMATYDEVYAWASQGNSHCSRMWMLHSQHPGKVYAGYPMYHNRTKSGCGVTNTGNIPRIAWSGVFDWNSEQKYNCACAGIR